MRYLSHLIASAAVLLAGCATSPTKFYADPGRPDDTSLCRVVLDEGADIQYRRDVADELVKRGLTVEGCKTKVTTQNAVVVGAALIGLTTAAVIACSDGRSCAGGGGGGGYSGTDYDCWGGSGNGPLWVHAPVSIGWQDEYDLDRDGDGIGCEANGDDR
jgi:hypothetical protein